MHEFNYFLNPICGFYIDKRYGLFQSHFISNIDSYNSEENILKLTKMEQYLLSEMVNIVFIQENYFIEDNFYKKLSEEDVDYSVFSDISKAKSAQEILARLETRYDHFLFYSNKTEILNFKEKLKTMTSEEISENEKEEVESENSSLSGSRPKRIDHIEYLMLTNEIQKDRSKTIEECYENFSREKYNESKKKYEEVLLRFNQPMSNILPPYYSNDYAHSLMSLDAYEQWLEEKNKSTYVIKQQEIINIEAQRLIPNMDIKMFNKTIIFTKYKQQIWTKYQQLWK